MADPATLEPADERPRDEGQEQAEQDGDDEAGDLAQGEQPDEDEDDGRERAQRAARDGGERRTTIGRGIAHGSVRLHRDPSCVRSFAGCRS